MAMAPVRGRGVVKSIWHLKTPYGAPRFYPPGLHPATKRMQEALVKMETAGFGDHEAADYIREELEKFERREAEVKAQYREMLEERC